MERDSAKTALPYGGDGEVVPVQKYRDVQKLCTTMTDGATEYVLYAVEGQKNVHYAMPVRNHLYDALDYARQVEETAKSHRRAMEKGRRHRQGEKTKKGQPTRQGQKQKRGDASGLAVKTPGTGEFLGGFWKGDRLIPSITVTILFSEKEWDGPLSLFDMMDVKNPELFSYMDNYHLRLIAPARMTDEEIMKFQSSLREVLFFIKYSKDRESMDRILGENEERFRGLERRAVDVIQAVTNSRIKYEESEEKVDMCQAIREMQEEAELRGREEGRKEMCRAIREMQEEAELRGREEG